MPVRVEGDAALLEVLDVGFEPCSVAAGDDGLGAELVVEVRRPIEIT